MRTRLIATLTCLCATLFFAAPAAASAGDHGKSSAAITAAEVEQAQKAWGEGIVAIGRAYSEGGIEAARTAADEHIKTHYGYAMGEVLFKPTLASEDQFRTTHAEALSYFVGGDPAHAEDKGFAIRPWSDVRWENVGTRLEDGMAVAMGNYYFTPADGGDAVKVEYSFAYVRDGSGALRIVLHDSSLPYNPGS
ncbi:MAG: phosphoribosyl-AMP cyclohydrolase [Myxococcota bacterium]|nr:phosphoribosyl-AMP cyclohydrolase [Myxococcota bacterium]